MAVIREKVAYLISLSGKTIASKRASPGRTPFVSFDDPVQIGFR